MSDPKQHHEPDDLDLDAETVRDLDPSGADSDDVRGGAIRRTDACVTDTCITCYICITVVACVAKP
jgi:hypothetical protein